MGSDHVAVVDISSDDEEEEEDLGRRDELDHLSFDWFDMFDRANGRRQDESDDVVVVEEFSAPRPKRRKQNSGSLGSEKGSGSDGDDDCQVLDSDPDKPVSVVDKGGGGDEGDDLLIVAEKGQLACRDYPHPRHLCANFPFSSSPHEKYCDLCHCYVCDSPAPCNYWGNVNSSSDHCHSTDKEARWKSLRQSFKQNNMVATQPQKLTDNSSFMPPFRDPIQPRHSNPNPLLVPLSRSSLLRSCSATSISNTNTNTNNQRNQYQPTILSSCSQRLGQQQPTKSFHRNPRIQRLYRENHVTGALTTQLMYSRTRFKRAGSRQAGFGSLNSRSHNTVSSNNHVPGAVPQKSTHVTITSQRLRCSPLGQQRSRDLLVTSPGGSSDQMQATASSASSQFTLATMQSSTCPPLTAADVNQKSWQDILASVACELGVSICSDTGITDSQPLMVPSPSLPYDKSVSETNASQETRSAPAVTNLGSLHYECTWSKDTMPQIPENGQGEDPHLSTSRTPNSMVLGSNTLSEETYLDSILSSIENEIL